MIFTLLLTHWEYYTDSVTFYHATLLNTESIISVKIHNKIHFDKPQFVFKISIDFVHLLGLCILKFMRLDALRTMQYIYIYIYIANYPRSLKLSLICSGTLMSFYKYKCVYKYTRTFNVQLQINCV